MVGRYTSIAIDGDDYPHISYFNESSKNLKYTYYDGNQWHISVLEESGSVGWYTSLALDTNDFPHISYYDMTNGDLKHIYFNGTGWTNETVDSQDIVGLYTSIEIDTDDHPHISYYDKTNEDLKYAYFDGVHWLNETVDSPGSVGTYTSLVLNQSNLPWICYYDDDADDLKVAHYDGHGWTIETVDAQGQVGTYCSIDLDSLERPHVSYYDITNGDLKHASHDGNGWIIESIDTHQDMGRYSSIAVDSNDMVHVSYKSWTHRDLKYAQIDNIHPTFDSDRSPETGYTGDKYFFNVSASDNFRIRTVHVNWTHGNLSGNTTLKRNDLNWTGNITLDHNITDLDYIIYVCDFAANYDITSPRHVQVLDNDPPEFGAIYNSFLTTGDPEVFSINATDNMSVGSVMFNFTINSQYNYNWSVTNQTSESWSIRCMLPEDAIRIDYYFWSVDGVGNCNRSVGRICGVTDNDGPIFINVRNSQLLTGNIASFTADIHENIALNSIEYHYSIDEQAYEVYPVNNVSGQRWRIDIPIPTDATSIEYYFGARDTSDNYNSSSTRTLAVLDDDGPTFISDDTSSTGTTGDALTFDISTFDNIDIGSVSVNWTHGTTGNNMTLDNPDNRDRWTKTIRTDNSTDDLLYTVYITDTSGNVLQTATCAVTILDNDDPVLLEHTISPTLTTGAEVNITVMAEDNIDVEAVTLRYHFDGNINADVPMTEGENGSWYTLLDVPSNATSLDYSVKVTDSSGNHILADTDPLTSKSFQFAVLDDDPPEAVAIADATVEVHEPISLYGNGSSDNLGIVSYEWTVFDTGNLLVKTGENTEYTFHDIGTYRIELNVTDAAGNRNMDNITVAVVDTTPPTAVVDEDLYVPQNEEIELQGIRSKDNHGIVNYTWSFVDNGTVVTLYGKTVLYRFSVAGDYNVTLTVTDASGNTDVDIVLLYVTDTTDPLALATIDGERVKVGERYEVEEDSTVNLSAYMSYDNSGKVDYSWKINGKGTDVEKHAKDMTYTFDEPGEFTVILRVTDPEGNSDALSFTGGVLENTDGDDVEPDDDTTGENRNGTGGESFGFLGGMLVGSGILLIIIIVLVVVLLMRKRKVKDADVGPEIGLEGVGEQAAMSAGEVERPMALDEATGAIGGFVQAEKPENIVDAGGASVGEEPIPPPPVE